jgi:hypothetical protein
MEFGDNKWRLRESFGRMPMGIARKEQHPLTLSPPDFLNRVGEKLAIVKLNARCGEKVDHSSLAHREQTG